MRGIRQLWRRVVIDEARSGSFDRRFVRCDQVSAFIPVWTSELPASMIRLRRSVARRPRATVATSHFREAGLDLQKGMVNVESIAIAAGIVGVAVVVAPDR